MTRLLTLALALALALILLVTGFVAGRVTATPRRAQDIPVVESSTASRTPGLTEAPLFVSGPVESHPADRVAPVPLGGASFTARTTGIASWYRYHVGQAAAGPALRALLGRHWRGMTVLVRVGSVCILKANCVLVRLTDWCGCPRGRIIDLDWHDFALFAPPSRGLVRVTVAVQ